MTVIHQYTDAEALYAGEYGNAEYSQRSAVHPLTGDLWVASRASAEWSRDGIEEGIFFHHSTDNGATWTFHVTAVNRCMLNNSLREFLWQVNRSGIDDSDVLTNHIQPQVLSTIDSLRRLGCLRR